MPRNPDLSPLWDARNGKFTEKKALGIVATFAAIPTGMASLLLGTFLVDENAPFGQLVLICGITAIVAVGIVLTSIFLIYKFYGFRPIVWIADGLIGCLTGFFVGMFLGNTFDHWLPFLICPIATIAWPIIAPSINRSVKLVDNPPEKVEIVEEKKTESTS